MDKILRIDMGAKGDPGFKEVPLESYRGLGGRALTSAIISQEVPPLCHPLDAHNKLVIAPGLLSGTVAAVSGRSSFGCKSPLTGGIKESNAGGQAAQVLARLGYAALVLTGKPDDNSLYKIFISKNGIEVIPDDSLRMLGNYDLVEKMKAEHGDSIACISIGQAGEMRMCAASVACTDMELRPTRHAGRGGVGAVMGSKGVKVIVLDGAETRIRRPADPEKFKDAAKRWVNGLKAHPITGQGMPAYGTCQMLNVVNEGGALPTRNFRSGKFEGAPKICAETLVALEKKRGGSATHGCHRGCIIQCSGTYKDELGQYVTKQPEYETVWSHGSNCGIDDLDAIAYLDRLDDDYGLDTIEMGATVAVAMEAGVVSFGDANAAINLVREVGKGTYLGRILGNGAAVTGKVFGVERVPVVKNQAIPAYDPRGIHGMGVTYATSPMGADHTAGYANNLVKAGGDLNPHSPEGQIEASRNMQIAAAALDSTGICLFCLTPILTQPESLQALLDLINTFYGLDMTRDDWTMLGKSTLRNERDFNTRAGFSSGHDRLPDFFRHEPLPPHNVVFRVKDEDLDTLFNW